MKLKPAFTLRGKLEPPLAFGSVSRGERVYYGVSGGSITGEGVDARIISGGEWALLCADGYIRVDVRLQASTEDGANIYLQYFGLLEMNEAVQAALASGSETAFEDQYFHINPRIETGDSRYAWMNTTFFVGQGRITSGPGVEYQVWMPDC